MLRRGSRPRLSVPALAHENAGSEDAVDPSPGASSDADISTLPLTIPPAAPPVQSLRNRRRFTWKRLLLAAAVLMAMLAAFAYPQRSKFSAQGADFSRKMIGDENTARIEALYFRLDDRVAKTKFKLLGGKTDPFGELRPRIELLPQPEIGLLVNAVHARPRFRQEQPCDRFVGGDHQVFNQLVRRQYLPPAPPKFPARQDRQ